MKTSFAAIGFMTACLTMVMAVSCDRAATPSTAQIKTTAGQAEKGSAPAGIDEGGAFYYSPFVLKLKAGPFDTVSFKDVGLDRVDPTPEDPLLEAVSQAFLYEIGGHAELGYEGEVTYDERLLEPSNHLYCGEGHLYVDLWRSKSPERWGYSMWSGCGEHDNFAWEEIEVELGGDASLVDEVTPVAQSMAERLAKADRTGCFRKECD